MCKQQGCVADRAARMRGPKCVPSSDMRKQVRRADLKSRRARPGVDAAQGVLRAAPRLPKAPPLPSAAGESTWTRRGCRWRKADAALDRAEMRGRRDSDQHLDVAKRSAQAAQSLGERIARQARHKRATDEKCSTTNTETSEQRNADTETPIPRTVSAPVLRCCLL